MKIIKKYLLHILLWVLMIIYLTTAPGIYASYFLQKGKPIQLNGELPAQTDRIKYYIDAMDLVKSNGQDLSNLRGWTFYTGDLDPAKYDRFIVLSSKTHTYVFPTSPIKRVDLKKTFKDLKINLEQAGFSSLISKDMISSGTYQIGFLFKQQDNGQQYYFLSGRAVKRTANQFLLVSNEKK